MFLTSEELESLTGYKISSAQKRWLDRNFFEYAISAYGKPKVLRSFVEYRLGITEQQKPASNQPDFSRWGVMT